LDQNAPTILHHNGCGVVLKFKKKTSVINPNSNKKTIYFIRKEKTSMPLA
jgi:hypothetical protein